MKQSEAMKIVDQIWDNYDTDESGELEKKEYMKLLKDISVLCKDPSIIK